MSEEMLDESVFESNAPDSSNYASAGQRFLTYLIDLVIYYVIIFVFGLIIGMTSEGILAIIPLLAFFAYYAVMEHMLGQTVGKIVTKTKVIKRNNKKANFLNIFSRSILRLIPFDSFSYLFGTEQGFHDLLSGTKLIIKSKETMIK